MDFAQDVRVCGEKNVVFVSAQRDEQLKYFSGVDHATRFMWQTEDSFVAEHEHAALIPLVEAIRALSGKLGRPVRVLESGCGEGVNLVHLKQLGLADVMEIKGLDMSAEAVAEAKRRGLPAEVGDGMHLPFADASYDVVFCRDVLHHLADDVERKIFFNEMWRVTQPGGFVAAIEPNPRNPGILALSYLISAERGLRSMAEEHVMSLLPGATVTRVAPSSVWRVLYHYRSPLSRIPVLSSLTRWVCRMWDKICTKGPGRMWSYRAYLWGR